MRNIPKDTGFPLGDKFGFVAIIGKPNVGKSTLLNQIIGERLAIATPKPQTTRNRIKGIFTRGHLQAVFVDTPGIHRARGGLNKRMVKTALSTISQVDLVLRLVEPAMPIDELEKMISAEIARYRKKCFLLINKIDKLPRKELLLPEIQRLSSMGNFDEVIPISALTGEGTEELLKFVEEYLPEGNHFYPPDEFTDLPEKFFVVEIIREQVILHTREEIPYAVAVVVEEFTEKPELFYIRAIINVETESQKGILIGKGGSMLKKIGTEARLNIEKMLGGKIFLELRVKVLAKWRKDARLLDSLGFREN